MSSAECQKINIIIIRIRVIIAHNLNNRHFLNVVSVGRGGLGIVDMIGIWQKGNKLHNDVLTAEERERYETGLLVFQSLRLKFSLLWRNCGDIGD